MKHIKKVICSAGISLLALNIVACANNSIEKNNRLPSSVVTDTVSFFDPATIKSEKVHFRSYSLGNDLNSFETSVAAFVDAYNSGKELADDSKDIDQSVVGKGFVAPYNTFELNSKGVYSAAKKMQTLIKNIKENKEAAESKYQIAQLTQAIEHLYDPPLQTDYEILTMPVFLVKFFHATHISGLVETPETPPFIVDEFQTDYQASDVNFYDYMRVDNSFSKCKYKKPKTGYGKHPGFQVECAGDSKDEEKTSKEVYKVKFGEKLFSGPFNSRIYRALGYRAPEINYVGRLKMKYNRRFLTEFNSRRDAYIKVKMAGVTVKQIDTEQEFDPFDFVLLFKLKNGNLITPKDAKSQLLLNPKAVGITDKDINDSFESRIDEVIFRPATATTKNDELLGDEVGPWNALDLDYRNFKEVRALIVADAWVGNYDMRKDNLRVFLTGKDSGQRIKVGFTDVGSGLGSGTETPRKLFTSSQVNDMPWEVSTLGSDGVVRLTGLMSTEINNAFSKIGLSDARWILEKMCRIKSDQIKQALVGSGMSSAEVTVAYAKLMNRRNKMLEDFDMEPEIKKACFVPVVTGTQLNYDPQVDGLVSIYSDAQKRAIQAPAAGRKVLKGVVVGESVHF